MFLYTPFTDSEGYFCSLLISNIFLFTSHSTDFLSSWTLIFNSTTLSTVINILEKRDSLMHQNLIFNFQKTIRLVLRSKTIFSLQALIYMNFFVLFSSVLLATLNYFFKTKLCFLLKNLCDLPVHWNHRFLSVSII